MLLTYVCSVYISIIQYSKCVKISKFTTVYILTLYGADRILVLHMNKIEKQKISNCKPLHANEKQSNNSFKHFSFFQVALDCKAHYENVISG